MNRGLVRERCRELGLDMHTLARQAVVDPFFLIDRLGLRAAAGLPIGLVEYFSRALGLDIECIMSRPHYTLDHVGDDIRLEAALMTVESLSREDIVHVFGWTLDRVERAVGALEGRLRATGSRLYHADGHRYWLGPARSLQLHHDRLRAVRRQDAAVDVGVEVANVVRLVIEGWTSRDTWEGTAAEPVVQQLLTTGLINDTGTHLRGSAEVEFSLCLHEPARSTTTTAIS